MANSTYIDSDRPSGIPTPGRFGAARNEMFALLLAIAVFAMIVIAFYFEARP
jgi:hypothetical protein